MAARFANLDGARIRLRALRADDAEALQAYRCDPQVARLQSWGPDYSLAQARALIDAMQATAFGTPGAWYQVGIALRADGTLIGDIGVHFDAGDVGQVEVGFTLAREHQGQGFAVEALTLLLDELARSQGIRRVRAVTDVRNRPARALLRRLEFLERDLLKRNGYYKGEWCDEVEYVIDLGERGA